MRWNRRISLLVTLLASMLALGRLEAQHLLPGEREAIVTAIPGVIAAGANWEIVWADFETAGGIGLIPTPRRPITVAFSLL